MPDGQIGLCGHMVGGKSFSDLDQLEDSEWLKHLREGDSWAPECRRCQQQEELGKKSVRQHSLERHNILKNCRSDYLIVGGILDNICNSACQFCNSLLSTKIGSLESGKNYQLTDNSSVFLSLPQERIVELDINGGEPSNSPNYSRLLDDLPVNCRIVRINTNASKFINQLPEILQRGIKVIVTISLDGTADVYEYARWPLKWSVFDQVVSEYMRLHQSYKNLSLNFWTTVSAYTINDMDNISDYARHKQIDLDWGLLDQPSCLNIRYSNFITTRAATKIPELQSLLASETDNNTELKSYIEHQDRMRGTDYRNIYG